MSALLHLPVLHAVGSDAPPEDQAVIALVVFLSMAAQDTFAGCYVLLLARHRLLAGLADGLQDVCQLFAVGLGGVAVFKGGASVGSAFILVALVAGSLVGAELGSRLSSRVASALNKEKK